MIHHTDEARLRGDLLVAAQQLIELGLNRGTSGNLSVRCGDRLLVTPSGVPVDAMTPEMMVALDFSGKHEGSITPSSEWQIHRDILATRADAGAVVHTHSMFATTIACLNRDIPPFHYMIAVAGGDTIRCAPYALFGSAELSAYALVALANRKACLLAHHGMVTIGHNLTEALAIAEEVESLCEQFWRILQMGEPKLLSQEQMQAVLERFQDYGQWNK